MILDEPETTEQSSPLHFTSTADQPWRHGQYAFGVELADGRELKVAADRVEMLPDGGLALWSDTVIPLGDKEPTPRPAPHLMLALPQGSWTACYAASAIDAAPAPIGFSVNE